jgi:hypothetical protein
MIIEVPVFKLKDTGLEFNRHRIHDREAPLSVRSYPGSQQLTMTVINNSGIRIFEQRGWQ